jgi:hypothetical protein
VSTARVPAGWLDRRSRVRAVSRPHDPHEREADQAADVVAGGGSVTGWSFSAVPVSAGPRVQRQEAGKPKSDEDKAKEALKKAGEAAVATPHGKALKEKVLADPLVKTVTDAVTSPAGLVTGGAALAGGVAALAATGKELPIQPPEIPLEKVSPKLAGVTAKVTYEGPVNAPTFVGLTITVKEQGPKGATKKGDPIAADTARLKAEEDMFRRGRTYAPGSKEAEEERLIDQAVRDYVLRRSALPGFTIPLQTPGSMKEDDKAPVQPAPASPSAAPPSHAAVDEAFSSPGRPIAGPVRRSMEARFGYDFSGVRIHDDARAARTAEAIDAAAFTVGHHIALGAGRSDGTAQSGEHLIAHELAHVVQQSGRRGKGAEPARRTVGRPLDASLRRFFEPRLAEDLGSVRVHSDAAAAAEAAQRRARAFTAGSDIVFAKGQYNPDTPRGRWLLAHELAHVAQARRTAGSADTATIEQDASTAATYALTGRPARLVARRDGGVVHRFGEPDHVPDLTFVSTSGEQGFLDQAVQYHRTWGLAPRRFSSMQGLLEMLAQDRGPIARLRIVSHANFDNIFTPLFDGGAAGITEDDLRAFGESDLAGLRRRLGPRLIRDRATIDRIVGDARSTNSAALQPFGLDQPGSVATGAVAQLVDASIDLLAVRTATGIPANQRGVLDDALSAELAGLRAQVQLQAPAGVGVTAAQAQGLQDAITNVTTVRFRLPAQPGGFIEALRTTTEGLAQGFRGNLDAVRARLSSASWIDLRGCRVGQHPTYLAATAQFFGAAARRPNVSGPEWFQSYPVLGFQAIEDARIRARAADADVRAALTHWSEVTGIRGRLMWWLRFLASVLREESELATAASASPIRPPSLAGGLQLRLDPFMLSLSETPLPLPPLSAPGLARPRPTGIGLAAGRLQNPLVAVARREIPRYTAPDGELRYYLEAGLPLPVQRVANVQNIFLLLKVGLERQAIDAWLGSQWEPAAPGLGAAQAGSWARGAIRQVEAVSQLDARRRTLAMFVSPDPRYAERIKTT